MFRYLVFALMFLLVACVPTKDNPAAYTQSIVNDAIRRYERTGLDATVEYFSSPENVDGQWYVFILDEHKKGIAHYRPERIGADASQAVDPAGYKYGDELITATPDGKWVTYINVNPETGKDQLKHAWIVLHDGLTFASGWYE